MLEEEVGKIQDVYRSGALVESMPFYRRAAGSNSALSNHQHFHGRYMGQHGPHTGLIIWDLNRIHKWDPT